MHRFGFHLRFARATLCLLAILTTIASAQALTFVAARAGLAGDPTIRPTQPDGTPVYIDVALPVLIRGDGRPDLFACHASELKDVKVPCRFLRPGTDGTVTDVTRLLLGSGPLPSINKPSQIVVGDFNGDGQPDIFLAAAGYDHPPFNGETNLLLISNGDDTYRDQSSTLPQTPDFSHSACAADINGDGNVDVLVNNVHNATGNTAYFLLGRGDGTFVQTRFGIPALITASAAETFESCAFADIDDDGYPDLILGGNYSGTTTTIAYNDGTGDFTRRPRYEVPRSPLSGTPGERSVTLGIVALDIDRDGRIDLMLMHSRSPSYDAFALQALIQQGDGTFNDESLTRLPASAVRLTRPFCRFLGVIDLNGDGWEDFYCDVSHFDASYPRYWLNNQNGTWSAVLPDPLGGSSQLMVHPMDIDGDGRADLVGVFPTKDGDIGYASFLNRAPRVVPSEPFGVVAVAGIAQATIGFKASLSSGTMPITSYTATCRFGKSVRTASGPASPLIVSGLANGKPYRCTVAASSGAGTSPPSAAVGVVPSATAKDAVIEYYNPNLDHFFVTTLAAEQANLDAGLTPTRWRRTGKSFNFLPAAGAGTSPVCRFYIPPSLGDSHFFGRGTEECDLTAANNPSFVLESAAFMHMVLPTSGTCPAATTPVYRVFSNRADANHRYTTDRATRDQMVARGWLAEGDGPDLVVMCAPP